MKARTFAFLTSAALLAAMQIEQLGPYRIGRRLGKGGMGSVYEAVDEKTGQRVAVKALTPQLAMAEGFRERFQAEIESLKKLQHEGIVRLLGYGEHEGILFYSMELVEGPSLEQDINSGRRFDWNETLSIAVQVCRALKHAHDHGIVHRDIKPANLLMAPDDRVKIADFGIARLFGATQLTTAGGVLGTADYMSPEQADGRAVTERCDQYALGCVMFALLAGRPPFKAKTMPEMLQMQRFAEPEPVRRYAPNAPEQLEHLISQLLSKEPSDRFPNVLVLGRHMEAMQRALSRPVKPEENGGSKKQPAVGPNDGTAVFDADATLSPEDLAVTPSETTDSGVYNAPTVSDDDSYQLSEPAAAAGSAAAASATAMKPKSTAPTRTSRFTTVEEADRLARQQQAHRWTMVIQLVLLATTLGGLAWLGWRLTRPATADQLYASIDEYVAEKGDANLTPVAGQIEEFLKRFPEDQRADAIRGYKEEFDLQKHERQLKLRNRMSGNAKPLPTVEIFGEAVRMQNTDPARAAAMLEALLHLYPKDGGSRAELSEDERTYLALAERQLAKLRQVNDKRAAEQLPVLKERLAAAQRLETSVPEQAAAMYQALVDLYDDQPWAADVVNQARARQQELGSLTTDKK
jgi:serine/threonine-protein kinase